MMMILMLWNDYQLQWDPSEYGGINVIRILSHKVWKPDIVLFNNADGRYEVSYKPNVVIFSNGDVMWIPPAIYKSSCTINVLYFPFDEQKCFMKFGSWTFNGDQVILDWYEGHEKVDLSDYVNSGTWDIIASPGVYNRTWDHVEGHHKAQITFTLRIRRKTLFYTVNLIIPCVLISFLSVCVFYLPADAGEKMTMCISILLALVVFLLLVSKILPPNSSTIPLIAKYLLFTFIMNIITIVITVVIINWNFKTPRTNTMPAWLRSVFLGWLPRLLLMRRPHKHLRRCERAGSTSGSKITWQKDFSRNFDFSTFGRQHNSVDIEQQQQQQSHQQHGGDDNDDDGRSGEDDDVNDGNKEIQLVGGQAMIKRGRQKFVRRCLSSEHLEFHTTECTSGRLNPHEAPSMIPSSLSLSRQQKFPLPLLHHLHHNPLPPPPPHHHLHQREESFHSRRSTTMDGRSIQWKQLTSDDKHSASSDDLLLVFNETPFQPKHDRKSLRLGGSSSNRNFRPKYCRQLDETRRNHSEEEWNSKETSFQFQASPDIRTPHEQFQDPNFIAMKTDTSSQSFHHRHHHQSYQHHHHHHHHHGHHRHLQSEQRFGLQSQKSCLKRRNMHLEASRDLMTSLSPEAAKAVDAVRFIAAHLKNEDEYNEILDDWRYIASVIDRLQLIIFLIVTVTGTAVILFNAPHIFEFVDQDEIKRRIIESSDGTLN